LGTYATVTYAGINDGEKVRGGARQEFVMTGGPPSAHTGSMDPDAVVEPHPVDPHVHGVAALKPRLRGWLHFGAAPLAFVLGLILMVITPTVGLRAAVAVYVLTTVLLFGVSAAYHLGAGSARVNDFLHKLDHANIYLFIAGSYTPFAAALPSATLRWTILALVWGIALVGLIVRVAWTAAPRWLVTGSYLALGWVAIFFLPAFYRDLGAATVALLAIGGILYSIGGVIYARKKPNPHPEWFGFHELFHAFTIAAYLVQYVAVAMVVTA
jgi:hemolysin III